MTEPFRKRIALILFVLLCGFGTVCSIVEVRGWGNKLSDVDAYSEANALREVRNFLEHGLTRFYGLGQAYYPGLYPADGFAREPEIAKLSLTPDGVYTHYPPGPEYLLYAAAKLTGPEPVSRLRLMPIAIGWAATLFLGLAVRRRFGAAVGWMVMAACIFSPAVTDGFAGLHYQGYATALLMLEIAIAIGANPRLFAFHVLGFFQGWLSFDYLFLVTLAPLALELAMPRIEPGFKPRWKLAMTRAVLAGAGFAAAHAVHFLQVWAYWGSIDAALRDFTGAAAHRLGAKLYSGPVDFLLLTLGNLKLYLYGLHPFAFTLNLPDPETPEMWSMFRFMGLSLGPWWLLITVGLMLWDHIQPNSPSRPIRMNWHFVCATGALTSSAWLLLMLDHASHHRHFLFRHLFFAFFVAVLFAAVTSHRYWIEVKMKARGHHSDPVLSLSET